MSGNTLYRQHADTYAQRSEFSLPNASYDRPAILRLAGDVTGLRVLELGCAAGVLTRQLVDRGASVLALDRELRMAALARQRLDGRARVEVADLEQPLDMVPDACIDLVVASLVLHYIERMAQFSPATTTSPAAMQQALAAALSEMWKESLSVRLAMSLGATVAVMDALLKACQ